MSVTTEFAESLRTVVRPGGFFVAGSQQMPAPGLEVDGVGPIGLPLPAVQAAQLIACADRAPYGRGAETVTDVTVRRTWQIGADRVHLRGRRWPETLESILARVAEGLGVTGPIEAELYKLLIYDEGSFFVPHRDTEKSPGMFATLVLVLPSVSDGGELIVRHKDREARLALRCEDPSEVAFGAFYADCVHEVLPVTAGHRLVLVYNLVRRGSGRVPGVPDYAGEVATVAELLERWAGGQGDDEPDKLIYPLEHAYSPAELGFAALKGADAGIGQVVVAAGLLAGCSVHLALVTIQQSGIAQPTGGDRGSWRGRYDDDDGEEFEVVEVCEHSAVADSWRRPDGEESPLTALPVLEEEFSPPVSFEELEPDEEHFHEATGNEGASFERSYRRAALVLWPEDRLLTVINQGRLPVTLPFLEDLAEQWARTGDAALRRQAGRLTDLMIGTWPMEDWYPDRHGGRSDAGRFVDVLVRLEDAPRLESFLTTLADRHGFNGGDSADLAAGLRVLPADRASEVLLALIEGAALRTLAACAALLAFVADWGGALALPAAERLVALLPADGAVQSPAPAVDRRRGGGVGPGFIVDLLTALEAIDAGLAAAAVDHILGSPRLYDFDTVLVPACLTLMAGAEGSAARRLRQACVEHLERRIGLDLEPPADWQRDAAVGCNCPDCQALSRFLADGTQKVWIFAAAQARRTHVETTIRYRGCDVDHRTEKRGSPHRLVCTKNQASYERRRVQRAKDLEVCGRLAAAG